MKPSEIIVGNAYHDGKQGLREVLEIKGADVSYKLLAARQSQFWSTSVEKLISTRGVSSKMSIEGFAKWAKGIVPAHEIAIHLQHLEAAKIKLSVGELAFMESCEQEDPHAAPGTMISFDHTEGRAISGLQKKGLVIRHQHDVELTTLGAAWLAIRKISQKH